MTETLRERLNTIKENKLKVVQKKEEVGQVLESFYQVISEYLELRYTDNTYNKEKEILTLLIQAIAHELGLEMIVFDDSPRYYTYFNYKKKTKKEG